MSLYNVVFIVIMYEVWIYFEHFVFVLSLHFRESKCYVILSYLVTLLGSLVLQLKGPPKGKA